MSKYTEGEILIPTSHAIQAKVVEEGVEGVSLGRGKTNSTYEFIKVQVGKKTNFYAPHFWRLKPKDGHVRQGE